MQKKPGKTAELKCKEISLVKDGGSFFIGKLLCVMFRSSGRGVLFYLLGGLRILRRVFV